MQEDGVGTAIQSLYRDLEYAKSLIKKPSNKSVDDQAEDFEESWTFIGDENDPELLKRIHQWEGATSGRETINKSDNENHMLTSIIDTGSGRNRSMESSIMATGARPQQMETFAPELDWHWVAGVVHCIDL